jgi:hypothetical protein
MTTRRFTDVKARVRIEGGKFLERKSTELGSETAG